MLYASRGRGLLVFAAVLFGLVVGSFLNVVIHRVPRRESIAWPASHCPHCGEPIRPVDNVPLFSYLLLRGRCRNCKERICARYPAVEALTGLL
ncbi:MAG: prepilin peptidase, partial [Rubrobacteraceae bacterium]|nr:prepilin peptidase [Rubrobacteraceae bacterium]